MPCNWPPVELGQLELGGLPVARCFVPAQPFSLAAIIGLLLGWAFLVASRRIATVAGTLTRPGCETFVDELSGNLAAVLILFRPARGGEFGAVQLAFEPELRLAFKVFERSPKVAAIAAERDQDIVQFVQTPPEMFYPDHFFGGF